MLQAQVSEGDPAPDFDATSADGRRIRLADYRGKKNVVLYFYPKDFTPGCTAEACSFEDSYEELVGQETEVIGVSLDDNATHRRFAHRFGIRFPLVADVDGSISRKYGALGPLGRFLGLPKRITFVIDKSGIVRAAFRNELMIGKHLRAVTEALVKCA